MLDQIIFQNYYSRSVHKIRFAWFLLFCFSHKTFVRFYVILCNFEFFSRCTLAWIYFMRLVSNDRAIASVLFSLIAQNFLNALLFSVVMPLFGKLYIAVYSFDFLLFANKGKTHMRLWFDLTNRSQVFTISLLLCRIFCWKCDIWFIIILIYIFSYLSILIFANPVQNGKFTYN